MNTVEKIIINHTSYGRFHENLGPELAGKPNAQQRFTMSVEFITDIVPGAFHQPEDLANWIASNPYVTSVTFNSKGETQ
jgi:hypothetical protein